MCKSRKTTGRLLQTVHGYIDISPRQQILVLTAILVSGHSKRGEAVRAHGVKYNDIAH